MTATTDRAGDGVAIVGMACLFPGAPDLDTYWRNILGKVDSVTDPPPESWDPDVYYDPEFTDPDRTYCRRGGYLGPLAAFDPLAHGIPPVAVGGEPDQWLALRVARDALADAGATELPAEIRTRTSVVLGKGTYLNGGNAIAVQRGLVVGQTIDLIRRLHPEHTEEELGRLREELKQVLPPLAPDTVPGLIPNIIVGRIANRLDLMGPAYTVDAACASSLVAVGHAVRDLRSGDCDLALAGGSQVWMPVATLNLFCRLGALSRRQQLRAFDKDADGTLLGEGIGVVVLKRLADALRDEDRVYAVIRGVGVSSDGRGLSVMAPRAEGEELALRRAYEAAGVSPRSVGLLEAHGTGTPVGDVTEVRSLTRVFGERDGELPRCALGTVKSMISHTIPAAGVAGLIKTALALHQGVLPPTLHCEEPNPELELERTPFYINTETRPWIHGGTEPRRAGINAFGFGGINAHAVLEELPGPVRVDHRPPWPTEVCVLQAASVPALVDRAAALAEALRAPVTYTLADLARSLADEVDEADGEGTDLRLAIVATSLEDLGQKLAQAVERLRAPDCRRIRTMSGIYFEAEPLGRDGKLAFVFPGEGAQYPEMLADLCLRFDEARQVFDRIDRLYAGHPRGHRLSDWVFPRPAFSEDERRATEARLMELDIAVESVLTANAALHAVVSRLVPRVDAIVGHSSGEHSAAMVAGALDLDSDERLATFCHGLNASYADAAARHEVPGAVLLALGADTTTAERIAAAAGGDLFLAMDNCPHQVVLVGDPNAAERARAIAVSESLMCEQLPYDRAVHTPLFAPFAADLRQTFAQLPVRAPTGPLWSCTTAAPYPCDPAQIRELLVEHWTSPVRFRETIEALHDDGVRMFVEVGPRGNLTAFVQDILRGRAACAVAADTPRRSGVTQINHLAGALAAHGARLNLGHLFAHRRTRRIEWDGEGPPSPLVPMIPLSTAWPMLRLDEAALTRVRGAGSGTAAPADSARSALPARTVHGNGTGNGNGNAHAKPQVAVPVSPVSPVAAAAPAAADVRAAAAAAVHLHLDTMERFLSVNTDVVHAFVGGAPASAPGAATPPLVGQILALVPGEQMLARRIVDPDQDTYLQHHALGWSVSRTDPGLRALTVMPLAMTIEILAEAAAALLPGGIVCGLRDVSAHRWLEFASSPRTLELRARRLPDEDGRSRVRVELHEADVEAPGGPAAEGTVLLAGAFPPPPAGSLAAPTQARPARGDASAMYGEVMFHGPLWQGVEAIEAVGPDGVRARLRTLPRHGLLCGTSAPDFVLDPVVLDAAGQVIGFWAAEWLERGRVVFPVRMAALDLFRAPPPPGQPLSCTAQIRRDGEQLTHSDIEVLAPDGNCWMRISGWTDKRFDIPPRFAPLTAAGRVPELATPWARPVAVTPGVACRSLDGRLGADAALWKRVWALRVLGRRERVVFDALRTPELRQLEWLAARTAAKDAVADVLEAHAGVRLLPAEIEILADADGCPRVAVGDQFGLVPIVSLTHTQGRAAAAAALIAPGSRSGIGIDMEVLGPEPPGVAEALGAAANRLLGSLAGGDRDEWLLRCWCAREAVGKALGLGLAAGGASPSITGVDRAAEVVTLSAGDRVLSAQTWRDSDLVGATSMFTSDEEDHVPGR